MDHYANVSIFPHASSDMYNSRQNRVLTVWRLLVGREVIADDAGPLRAPTREHAAMSRLAQVKAKGKG